VAGSLLDDACGLCQFRSGRRGQHFDARLRRREIHWHWRLVKSRMALAFEFLHFQELADTFANQRKSRKKK